jgi:hypothetical protein
MTKRTSSMCIWFLHKYNFRKVYKNIYREKLDPKRNNVAEFVFFRLYTPPKEEEKWVRINAHLSSWRLVLRNYSSCEQKTGVYFFHLPQHSGNLRKTHPDVIVLVLPARPT